MPEGLSHTLQRNLRWVSNGRRLEDDSCREAGAKRQWVKQIPEGELSGEPYKLAERVKNDEHCRKGHKDSEEFNVADTCETGEGEILQGEDGCQVSCHWKGVEGEWTRPTGRGGIKPKNQSYHCESSADAAKDPS